MQRQRTLRHPKTIACGNMGRTTRLTIAVCASVTPTLLKAETALMPRKTIFGTAQAIIGKPCAPATRLTAVSAVTAMSATIRTFAMTEIGGLCPANCEDSNSVLSEEYRGSGT